MCTSLTLIRYFYSWSGRGPNSLESQLKLIVLLGFGIPYIPYQKLLGLFLVCTSLALSGISTLGQEGVQTLWSLSSLTVLLEFGIPYIPYQKLLGLFLLCTSLTLIRYFYSWSGEGLNSLESQLTLTVLLQFDLREVIVPISVVHLSDTYQVFLLLIRRGSKLFGVSAHTDSAIRIWHSLYTLPEVIRPISCVHFSDAYQVFLLFVRRGSKLFGVSAHTDSAITILHSLYTLPDFIVPISGMHPSDIFRYFYSWSGEGPNSLESQLTLTVLLGFRIPYIP